MRKKYKIGINVSPLSNGNSIRGVGYYTKKIVESIQKEIKNNPDYSDFNIRLITDKSQLTTNFDLIHYPYFDPFRLTLPTTKIPFVISVHDLIPIEFKHYFPVGLKGNLKWLIQKFLLKKAKYIITISHYSKYIIHELTGYPQEKIFTSYLAADPTYKPINNQELLEPVIKKYNLPKKFVLYLGDIDWSKNVPTLVKACQALKYTLVIVGSSATSLVPIHPWTKDIHWLQNQVKNQKDNLIRTIGYASDEDLPLLFNLATIYCQPSFGEGFGLAVIKAMQTGCPVVYSQATSLPEVMDYNGLPFDPNNQKDLEEKLSLLWNDKTLRQSYIKKGFARAKTFDWQQTALSTLAVYRLALIDEKK